MPLQQTRTISDALIEEAAAWRARLDEPDAGAATRAAFRRWLACDPLHREAYAEVERLWAALDAPVAAMTAGSAAPPTAAAHNRRPHPSRRSILRGAAVAASVALPVLAGVWWLEGGLDDLRSDHVTGIGERETVALADGSEITLNTDTALAVDVTDDRRAVTIFRGEAYFAVAKDAARPFTVETPAAVVRVVGTEFNLRAAGERAVVSVLRGAVDAAPVGAEAALLRLRGGQEAVLAAGAAGPVRPVDAAAVTAWLRGQIVFYRTPLGAVVEELNRYHAGRIVIVDGGLRDLSVTGVFDATRPLAALDAIERTLGARSVRLMDRLVLLH